MARRQQLHSSTAINELEMWQADTFDLPTIDRELGWAEEHRHEHDARVPAQPGVETGSAPAFSIAWTSFCESPTNITFASCSCCSIRSGIRIRKSATQRAPKPHMHNSGWVQAPGAASLKNPASWSTEIEPYIKAVVGRFGDDRRVVIWDLMNEPDNENGQYKATELPNKAEAAAAIARESLGLGQRKQSRRNRSPAASGRKLDFSDDAKLSAMENLQLENSDVITFHNYDPPEKMHVEIHSLRHFHRPVICTEYMARPRGSTFETVLPVLKQEKVGAYNWGFVSGKTQTIFAWDSWEKQYAEEPPLWFHDIFRRDGTAVQREGNRADPQTDRRIATPRPSVGTFTAHRSPMWHGFLPVLRRRSRVLNRPLPRLLADLAPFAIIFDFIPLSAY